MPDLELVANAGIAHNGGGYADYSGSVEGWFGHHYVTSIGRHMGWVFRIPAADMAGNTIDSVEFQLQTSHYGTSHIFATHLRARGESTAFTFDATNNPKAVGDAIGGAGQFWGQYTNVYNAYSTDVTTIISTAISQATDPGDGYLYVTLVGDGENSENANGRVCTMGDTHDSTHLPKLSMTFATNPDVTAPKVVLDSEADVITRLPYEGHTINALAARSIVWNYGPLQRDLAYLWVPMGVAAPANGYPVAMYVHGGRFNAGGAGVGVSENFLDKDWLEGNLNNGVAVCSVEYALSDEDPGSLAPADHDCNGATMPDPIKDIHQANAKLQAGAGTSWDIDPTRVVISGHSAGAYLAMMAWMTHGDETDYVATENSNNYSAVYNNAPPYGRHGYRTANYAANATIYQFNFRPWGDAAENAPNYCDNTAPYAPNPFAGCFVYAPLWDIYEAQNTYFDGIPYPYDPNRWAMRSLHGRRCIANTSALSKTGMLYESDPEGYCLATAYDGGTSLWETARGTGVERMPTGPMCITYSEDDGTIPAAVGYQGIKDFYTANSVGTVGVDRVMTNFDPVLTPAMVQLDGITIIKHDSTNQTVGHADVLRAAPPDDFKTWIDEINSDITQGVAPGRFEVTVTFPLSTAESTVAPPLHTESVSFPIATAASTVTPQRVTFTTTFPPTAVGGTVLFPRYDATTTFPISSAFALVPVVVPVRTFTTTFPLTGAGVQQAVAPVRHDVAVTFPTPTISYTAGPARFDVAVTFGITNIAGSTLVPTVTFDTTFPLSTAAPTVAPQRVTFPTSFLPVADIYAITRVTVPPQTFLSTFPIASTANVQRIAPARYTTLVTYSPRAGLVTAVPDRVDFVTTFPLSSATALPPAETVSPLRADFATTFPVTTTGEVQSAVAARYNVAVSFPLATATSWVRPPLRVFTTVWPVTTTLAAAQKPPRLDVAVTFPIATASPTVRPARYLSSTAFPITQSFAAVGVARPTFVTAFPLTAAAVEQGAAPTVVTFVTLFPSVGVVQALAVNVDTWTVNVTYFGVATGSIADPSSTWVRLYRTLDGARYRRWTRRKERTP